MYKKYEVYASCYVLNKFVIEIRQRKSRVILHVCRDLLLVDNALVSINDGCLPLPLLGEVDLSNADSVVACVFCTGVSIGPGVSVEGGKVEVLGAVIVLPRRHTHGVRLGSEITLSGISLQGLVKDLNGAATVVENGLNSTVREHWPFVLAVVGPRALPDLFLSWVSALLLDVRSVEDI